MWVLFVSAHEIKSNQNNQQEWPPYGHNGSISPFCGLPPTEPTRPSVGQFHWLPEGLVGFPQAQPAVVSGQSKAWTRGNMTFGPTGWIHLTFCQMGSSCQVSWCHVGACGLLKRVLKKCLKESQHDRRSNWQHSCCLLNSSKPWKFLAEWDRSLPYKS